MPFFPNDFFADTAHVQGDVAAYYLVLLGHAWARGGSLPDDDDQLRLMARCPGRRWPQIRDALRTFWSVGEDGRLHQKRMDQEWQLTVTKRQSKDGWRLRHNGKKTNDSTRARSRVPHPHPYKEEKEDARRTRANALTRDPPVKNGSQGRGARHGKNREPNGIDLVIADIERLERLEAAEQRKLLRIEGGPSDPLDLGPIPPVRH